MCREGCVRRWERKMEKKMVVSRNRAWEEEGNPGAAAGYLGKQKLAWNLTLGG